MFKDMKFKTQLIVGFAIILVLMTILSTIVYISVNQLGQNTKWVIHTYEVVEKGKGLMSSMVDQETGLRGFLVAGQDEYLDPYYSGNKSFKRNIKELQNTVSDNPTQVKRLEGIEKLAEEWDTKVAKILITARGKAADNQASVTKFNRLRERIVGKQIFDGFRTKLAKVQTKFSNGNNDTGTILINQLLMDMVNMETGQRGFLLSGDDASLDPYRDGKSAFDDHIYALKGLINAGRGSGVRISEIDELNKASKEWREKAADPEIAARVEVNNAEVTMDDVNELLQKVSGKVYMDKIRVDLNAFVSAEQGLLEVRNKKATSIQTRTNILAIFGTLFAILIGIGVILYITKSVMNLLGDEPAAVAEVAANLALGDTSMIMDPEKVGLYSNMADLVETLKEKADAAEQIGNGNIDVDIKVVSEKDVLAKSMVSMKSNIQNMAKEIENIAIAGAKGRLDVRGDAGKFEGSYASLIEGVNGMTDSIVNILDSIPTPIMRVDKEMNVTYMNTAATGALEKTLKEVIGQKCHSLFKTSHCNTKECRTAQAMRQGSVSTNGDTVAKLPSVDLPIRYVAAPLKDDKGNVIGGLEYVTDISKEMELTGGIQNLVKAAQVGDLDAREDINKFEGNYQTIITGVNGILQGFAEPINSIGDTLTTLAGNDLSGRVNANFPGFYGSLANNVNDVAGALDEAMQQVAEAVEQVSSASGQIANGSQSLAEGTNEQASSIEEVSSSLEEMSSMTQQNSDNANKAKSLSDDASVAADKGAKNMEEMSVAINKIKDSSDETAKIVKTIDEIAFQTNLLALNAAVEAARAGEAGKGFAVVAEEVRNLAQRSADAAKNTAEMIQESVQNSEEGVKITKVAADGLGVIVENVNKTNDLIGEIAAASKEQTTGIEQINNAIQGMNKVTQDNASNSEESASAAEEMSAQARGLADLVGTFKVSGGSGRASGRSVAVSKAPVQVNRAPKAAPAKKKSKIIRPDDVIPMDDDDFGDI